MAFSGHGDLTCGAMCQARNRQGVPLLQMFGVLPRTEAVYCAMLTHPSADVSQLATLLALSVQDVTSELDRLAELMLVQATADDAGPLLAVPPEQAIEALIAREEERMATVQQQVREARRDVDSFVNSFVESRIQRDEHGIVEQIDDPRVVTSRLFQLARGARQRVSFMLPGDALPPPALAPSARLDDELLSRRIPLRFIVTEASLRVPHWREHLLTQAAKGVQVRSHPAPPIRAVIVDSNVGVLTREGSPGALVVHGTDLVRPVDALFEEIWHDALAVRDAEEGDRDLGLCEARIRQVVLLLAQGHKDETIARRLGVSVRTVRRLVSDVVSELHAESRFQAGVLALKRGWLD